VGALADIAHNIRDDGAAGWGVYVHLEDWRRLESVDGVWGGHVIGAWWLFLVDWGVSFVECKVALSRCWDDCWSLGYDVHCWCMGIGSGTASTPSILTP